MKKFLLSFLMLALLAGSAWAATLEVPAGYGTIQSAINAANPGDVVAVAAGTYAEGSVIINKPLNLVGPNAGVPTDGARVPEAVISNTGITFANGTSGVVIDGFTLTGTSAINVWNASADYVTVRYNRFVDLTSSAIYTQNAANSHNGWVISYNLFSNIGYNGNWNSLTSPNASALNLWNTSNLTVTHNVLQGVAYNGLNMDTVAGATVQNNTFRDIGKTGLQIAYLCVGPMDISSNLFERCNGRYPIDFNYWYGAIKWYSTNATGVYSITNNVMNDCVVGYMFARKLPLTGGPTVTFTGNTMSNNTFAGFLQYQGGGPALDLSGNGWNHHTGPALALFDFEHVPAGIVDPEPYVTANGGGQGDRLVTNATDPVDVVFSPWTGMVTLDAGWNVFVIRAANSGGALPAIVENDPVTHALGISTELPGQKVGLGTNLINGVRVSQISSFHIDRLDGGTSSGPYVNLWVTDGLGHYAVLAYAPGWDVQSWAYLKDRPCYVYETIGAAGGLPGTSWVAPYVTNPSVGLTFGDVANLVIDVPSAEYRTNGLNGVGTGAPDELNTNVAYGFNWMFGDTAANYLNAFVVDNYYATATLPTVSIVPASAGPINCGQTQTLTFSLTRTAVMPDVFGFSAVVRATGQVNWGTITSSGAFGSTTQFLRMNQGDGSYLISGTTTGLPTQPITGAGTTPLFTVQYTPTGTGSASITFDSFTLRDPNNAPIPVVATGTTFAIDCTAPAAVTNITATPGHNKVNVGWTHTGIDVANYVIYRGVWNNGVGGASAYPEYDDLTNRIPARPTTRADAAASADWAYAGTCSVGTTFSDTWANAANRGVYYYEVFAVDAANNSSPAAAAAANNRATNYWLGDVAGVGNSMDPNGLVDVGDMTVLGTWFGISNVAVGSVGAKVDVGPTYNYSRLGIPTTDSKINFEDLMIFAMNFGVVTTAKSEAIVGSSVDLAWVRYDNGSMALRLVDGSGLKGVRVTANKPVGALVAGGLLDEQSELTFAQNIGETLDANVAVMGVNTTFTGTGDLFVIPAGEAIELSDLTITARAIDNSKMEVKLTSAAGGQATPRAFALNGNYPNPFNPMTKISFSLPETQHVRLMVYGLDGRKVATLLDETRGAGLHEIVWTGRDDAGQSVASGTYFYRVDAGPYSDVRKMTLMK